MSIKTTLIFALALLAASTALAQIPSDPSGPPEQPGDREVFKTYHQKGHEALTPQQLDRLAFWLVYLENKTSMANVHNGALVAENFDGPELSLSVKKEGGKEVPLGGEWRIWHSDPALRIAQEDGLLCIKGKTSRAGGLNFNGIVGTTYGETDVVAIAEMKPVAPPAELPGFHVSMFHLCGSSPDLFNEICFGRIDGGEPAWTHYQTIKDAPLPGDSIPPMGGEADAFHAIKLEHVADTEISRAWLKTDGAWRELGKGRPVVMSTTKVELKVDVPVADADIECYFDNCRLYPRPETHPVKFVAYTAMFDNGTETHKGVQIQLFLNGGAKPVGQDVTDEFGRASITLPSDVDYPAAGVARIKLPTGETWERKIECKDVVGIYPGSVWSIRINTRELKGDKDWWKEIKGSGAQPKAEAK